MQDRTGNGETGRGPGGPAVRSAKGRKGATRMATVRRGRERSASEQSFGLQGRVVERRVGLKGGWT